MKILLLSMLVFLATATGLMAQPNYNDVTNIPPIWQKDAKEVFSTGEMCFIWPGTNVLVEKKADAISIGPFFALSDRPLSFKVSTKIPGYILINNSVFDATPKKATQFELSFDPQRIAGKTEVSVQLIGYGIPSNLWAGKSIGNTINLMVDTNKLEAQVLPAEPR
jgi:hypothetical protein